MIAECVRLLDDRGHWAQLERLISAEELDFDDVEVAEEEAEE